MQSGALQSVPGRLHVKWQACAALLCSCLPASTWNLALPFHSSLTHCSSDLREVTLEVGGAPVLRFAAAYGFRNIQVGQS